MDNYSLSDVAAVTRNNDDTFGGSGILVLVVLFLFFFMRGGMWGNSGLDTTQLQNGFDTSEITRKLDGITNGLCDGFYAQNTTMLNGFAGVTSAVDNARFANQQCCCETNRNIDSVRYDNQKNTCDIISAIHAEGEATRGLIQANEMQTLRDKVSELQLAQSQCAQNAYLVNQLRPCPIPAYPSVSPYATVSSCNGCNG